MSEPDPPHCELCNGPCTEPAWPEDEQDTGPPTEADYYSGD